jgi:hypothetical protein
VSPGRHVLGKEEDEDSFFEAVFPVNQLVHSDEQMTATLIRTGVFSRHPR